nr:MAG TPA: hypothetical protein [Caudoviricetes sp.]
MVCDKFFLGVVTNRLLFVHILRQLKNWTFGV